ncbi:MAG: hypothetical protein AAF657_22255 [Acidobacteriota bacterium]
MKQALILTLLSLIVLVSYTPVAQADQMLCAFTLDACLWVANVELNICRAVAFTAAEEEACIDQYQSNYDQCDADYRECLEDCGFSQIP